MALAFPLAGRAQAPNLTNGTTRFSVLTNELYFVDNYGTGGGHLLYTYNLGPTGLRGWIYTATDDLRLWDMYTSVAPYQILVTDVGAGTPASGILQKTNDVILGVKAGAPPVALFTNDTRVTLGNAITEAEAGNGKLSFLVNRYGVSTNLTLTIQLGITNNPYSATAPYNCPKSALILSNALTVINNRTTSRSEALAMLASGNPAYQTKVRNYVRSIAPTNLKLGWPTFQDVGGGQDTWTMGYNGLLLSEYYAVTADTQVTNGLIQYITMLAKSDTMWGCYGHAGAKVMPYHVAAGVHGYGAGYGPMISPTLIGKTAVALGQRTGLPAIVNHPEVQPAIDRTLNFCSYFVDKGGFNYGEMPPWDSHAWHMGKSGMAALFFGVATNQPTPVQTEYFVRHGMAGHKSREWGHNGSGFGQCWAPLGIAMGGTNAIAAYFAAIRWHVELARRSDGSFAHDCPGDSPVTASTYFGYEDYQGFMDPTSWNALFFSLPLRKLYITGKNANPINTISAAAATNAIWAGQFEMNLASYTTNQLVAALGEYDPGVRAAAAARLGTICSTNSAIKTALTAPLKALTTNDNARLREAACNALGSMVNTSALTELAARMSDTNVWVRYRANQALDKLGTDALPQLSNMMTAFATYASPDPLVAIDWNDPCGWGNGNLSHLLFQTLAANTINQSTNLLYPAVIAGLRQPDRGQQAEIGSFLKNQLRWQDVLALAPALMGAGSIMAQADPMWDGAEADVLTCLAKHGVPEGLAALAVMTESGVTMSSNGGRLTQAYQTYGTAATPLIPSLNNMQTTGQANASTVYLAAVLSNPAPSVTNSFNQFTAVSATPASVPISAATNVVLNVVATDLTGWGLRYQWSVAQGPAPVTFSAATSTTCTASFSVPGAYILQAAVAPVMDRNLFWDPAIPGGDYMWAEPTWTFNTWTNFYGATYSNVTVTVIGTPSVDNAGGAINQTVDSATPQGCLTGGGEATAWICWGAHDAGVSSTGAWDKVVAVGTVYQGGVFSLPVTGLATNKTYFYRCFVTSQVGQAWSAAATSFSALPARGAFGYSMKISFTNYNRTGTLTNFTALVAFSNGMAGTTFNFDTFLSPNGYDLRFTDSTGLTNLNYEIENWTPGSSAHVWVQVPRFSNNCNIFATWGAVAQTNQLACTTNGAAWDSSVKGVWHFPLGANLTANDSTANRNNGTVMSATAANGMIGGGMKADSGKYIELTNNSGLDVSGGNWSMQGWAKCTDLFWAGLVNTRNAGILGSDGHRWSVLQGDGNVAVCSDAANNINTFQHVMATRSGTAYKIYINGVLQSGVYNEGGWGMSSVYRIGRGYADSYVIGSIDEVRVENTARSDNWIWACYMNMASNALFNTPGPVLPVSTPIANSAPVGITSNAATLKATLSAPGTNYAVTVYWGSSNGRTNATLWANSASVGSWTNVALTNISYQATGLTAGMIYYYAFRAVNAGTNVWAQPSWQFAPEGSVTLNELLSPTALSATPVSSTQVNLYWTDNSSDETGFLVERSATSGTGFTTLGTTLANTTNYTDSTVSAASTYYYRVSATNATISSPPSGEASVTTPKIPATVTLSALSQTYDGTARSVTTTTDPAGLTVNVTYNGDTAAPTNAGNYAVTGTVMNATYQGWTNGTLIVNQATQTITFASLASKTYGDAPFALSATASSGLPVSYSSSDTNVATIAGGTVTILNAGATTITATQAGNINTAAAIPEPQLLTVGKAMPVLTWNAPAFITIGTPLSSNQLNATSGGVAGTFVYTPPAGTVLPVGEDYVLSVTFTPADTANYSTPPVLKVFLTVSTIFLAEDFEDEWADNALARSTNGWTSSGVEDQSSITNPAVGYPRLPHNVLFPLLYNHSASRRILSVNAQGAALKTPPFSAGFATEKIYVDLMAKFETMPSLPTVLLADLTAKTHLFTLGNGATTNLVVLHGQKTAEGFDVPTFTSLDQLILPGTWYRLTITFDATTNNTGAEAFSVRLNGEPLVSSAAYSDTWKTTIFTPSYQPDGGSWFLAATRRLGSSGPNLTSLTEMTFTGSGFVDDLVVTADSPTFTPGTLILLALSTGSMEEWNMGMVE